MNAESNATGNRVLITGATGFLGKAVVRVANERGLTIRTTGRSPKPTDLGIEYVQADLLSDDLSVLVDGVDIVLHLAGLAHVFDKSKSEHQFFAVNADATGRLAAAAADAGVRHFVLASSVAVYGGNVNGPCPESAPCHPLSAYAKSKLRGEQLATEVASDLMAITILRLATLYGPGDPGNVARLLSSINRGKFIWIGKGTNRKSLVYRDDAAHACIEAALAQPEAPATYNVSAPPESMRSIVEGLAHELEKPASRIRIPTWLATSSSSIAAALCLNRGPAVSIKRMIKTWLADDVYPADLIESELGWRGQTPLAAGLASEVEWYQNTQSTKS
ncbi:MAG: NAD-dependent epimerase/dehydratase family protein [Planctomycetota bacterium]